MFKSTLKACSLGFCIFASTSASATLLDFTSSYWNGVVSDVVLSDFFGAGNDLTVTLSSYNVGDFVSASCQTKNPDLECSHDGLGVGDDEITEGHDNNQESITVTFSSAVNVENIYLLDLFKGAQGAADPATEVGEVVTNGGTAEQFGGLMTNAEGLGYLDYDTLLSSVTSLTFTALPTTGNYGDFDYALAGLKITNGITTTRVPEPSPLVLLGFGLIALGALRKTIRNS